MAVDKHLKRVTGRIEGAILEYCELSRHRTWNMDDMRKHIVYRVGAVAPASPDRVLRSLRQRHQANYRVINRSKSLYEWLPLARPVQRELPVVA